MKPNWLAFKEGETYSPALVLEETVRILGDYVTLSGAPAKPNLTATMPSPITR